MSSKLRILVPLAILSILSHLSAFGRELSLIEQALQLDISVQKRGCLNDSFYNVYHIDNFDQQIELVPELDISHGDLVHALLVSGRNDIHVKSYNMSLGRGLARAIIDARQGVCIDGIVSAIPGSNYTYEQVATILGSGLEVNENNILRYKNQLRERLLDIAYNGFPSVQWLVQLDANPVKVREDAKKVALIEILGKIDVGVYLPYGNRDKLHRGKVRSVNLLGVAQGVQIYSGLDAKGARITGFPYSPLSSGSAQSRFTIVECPDGRNGQTAYLDINEDGNFDFTYERGDMVAYLDETAQLSYAPPPVGKTLLEKMLADKETFNRILERPEGFVISRNQYRQLVLSHQSDLPAPLLVEKQLVWLNSSRYGALYSFDPECRERGYVEGSSLIPPLKMKELLVRKNGR